MRADTKRLVDLARIAADAGLPLQEAFRTAVHLEDSLIESQVFVVTDGDSPEVAEVLGTLREQTGAPSEAPGGVALEVLEEVVRPPAVKALVLSALTGDEEHGAAYVRRRREDAARARARRRHGRRRGRARGPMHRLRQLRAQDARALRRHDDMQGIFRKIVASDVLVLATPVRFGSYCAELKKVVDHFQPLMQPIYVVRHGEMHFRARYDLPALLGVGLVPAAGGGIAVVDGGAEGDAFRFLIGRLAANIDTSHAAAVWSGDDSDHARSELERALDVLREAHS